MRYYIVFEDKIPLALRRWNSHKFTSYSLYLIGYVLKLIFEKFSSNIHANSINTCSFLIYLFIFIIPMKYCMILYIWKINEIKKFFFSIAIRWHVISMVSKYVYKEFSSFQVSRISREIANWLDDMSHFVFHFMVPSGISFIPLYCLEFK